MANISIMTIYKKNKDFQDYVKRYIRTTNLTVKEALKHSIVQEAAKEYNYISEYGDQISMEWLELRKNEAIGEKRNYDIKEIRKLANFNLEDFRKDD